MPVPVPVIHSIIPYVCHPFPPLALWQRLGLTVRDGASSHQIEYVVQAWDIKIALWVQML